MLNERLLGFRDAPRVVEAPRAEEAAGGPIAHNDPQFQQDLLAEALRRGRESAAAAPVGSAERGTTLTPSLAQFLDDTSGVLCDSSSVASGWQMRFWRRWVRRMQRSARWSRATRRCKHHQRV